VSGGSLTNWPALANDLSQAASGRPTTSRRMRRRSARSCRRAMAGGRLRPIVKVASERAKIHVLAQRASDHGRVGEPAPVHPHLLRHARVRQIVRHTKSLALAQKQAGWVRLHTEYLTLSDIEAERLMQSVQE